MTMLMKRVATSFALLFLILGAIFGLSQEFFVLFIAVVIGFAVWEWTSLAGLENLSGRLIYTGFLLGIAFISNHFNLRIDFLLMPGLVWWAAAFVLVCIYPGLKRLWGNTLFLSIAGILLFVPGWHSFAYLRAQEYYPFHLLLLFGLVSAADIGAYFSGRAFGSRKLAPRVSPNKTWEGFIGGILACSLLMTVVAVIFLPSDTQYTFMLWGKLISCTVIIASFSVVGDLFESMVKRFRDVKDSGKILPGHGGLLDRIDGLTAAAPVYALLFSILGNDFT